MMSIGAAFALVIFPPACGMTLLVSELAFATRAKREAVVSVVGCPIAFNQEFAPGDMGVLRY